MEQVAVPVAAWTVSQVHAGLDRALQVAGMAELWVSGTVSGLRRRSRFVCFELVEYEPDATTVRAVLPVGVFAREGAAIARVLEAAGVVLADGLEVAVFGRLAPNGPYGPLRLVARAVDPRLSVGAAALARRSVLAGLESSGELWAQRRLVLPAVPRRIGLICPRDGAGGADVRAGLPSDRFQLVEVSAAMSGPNAPGDVAAALGRLCAARVELILVARGGGPRSDLAAWDSAEVAHAIARCPLPVWTALGHATDRTLADVAANAAFPTPSAAAAALVARAAAAEQQARSAEVQARQHTEVVRSQRRARRALAVAVLLAAVVAVLVIRLLAGGQ